MRKAGGIIAIIAGVFAMIAALITIGIGGISNVFGLQIGKVVMWLGWGGLVFSFAVIVLGAVCVSARSRMPSVFLVFCAVCGIVLGGTYVAVFMGLALIGGLLALFAPNPAADGASSWSKSSWSKSSQGQDSGIDPQKADEIIARYLQQNPKAGLPAGRGTGDPGRNLQVAPNLSPSLNPSLNPSLSAPRAAAPVGFGKRR